MVRHDLNQAIRYSDNIYVLKQGEVYNFGKPNDRYLEAYDMIFEYLYPKLSKK